jgi:hypothetical protein
MRTPFRYAGAIALIAVLSLGAARKSTRACLVEPISMYLADSTLYVIDKQVGIHLYRTAVGAAPSYMSTVSMQGVGGVAVSNGIVYANSWESILALRVAANGAVDTVAVVRQSPQYYDYMPEDYYYGDHRGWGCSEPDYAAPEPAPVATGTGSSYAVFAVIDTFLYYVDGSNLIAMSIAAPASPRILTTTYLSWDLETLFPTENYLFVGSTTGMYILNRRPDPTHPTLINVFQHARACDPVVVQDTIAYVALRSGSACGAASDALMAISIADPVSTRLLCQVTPSTPYGLAVSDTAIYVGNGSSGFSLYSAARPDSLRQIATWATPAARDFIWWGNTLYLMGFTEIAAYDVSVREAPVRLGRVQ